MTRAFRELRESLSQLGALASDLPRQVATVSLVAEARDRVADRLGLSDMPTPEEEDALLHRFRTWLDGERSSIIIPL